MELQVFIVPSLEEASSFRGCQSAAAGFFNPGEAVNFHPLPQPPMDIVSHPHCHMPLRSLELRCFSRLRLAEWLDQETDLLPLLQMGDLPAWNATTFTCILMHALQMWLLISFCQVRFVSNPAHIEINGIKAQHARA